MLNKLPRLYFLHPEKNLPPYIYRLLDDPQAGEMKLLCGAQCTGQGSGSSPVRPGGVLQVSPYALPKGTKSQPHNLFKLLISILPTLNSFSSELISRFPPYVIKPQGNKEKTGEWRKTMVESARRKRRSRRSLSSGFHLLMNKKQTIFVIKDIIIT